MIDGENETRSEAEIPKHKTENQVAKKIRESATQIWLAGLGAFSKAEKEGGKLFENLVKDGEKIENWTRDRFDRQFSVYKEKVGEVKEKAADSWVKIEKAFDERVSSALSRLLVPKKSELESLERRVEQLEQRVEQLAAKSNIKESKPH